MAPPQNLRRRGALADAAIQILGTAGIHKLSHRAVDEQAWLPPGTASNYFPRRDDLLAAAAHRVAQLNLADMAAANREAPSPAGPDLLARLIGTALHDSATRHRIRYLAFFELALEATRQPQLAETIAQLGAAMADATLAEHSALGLHTTPQQVRELITLYAGTLLTLVTGPPEAVTPERTLALARCLVSGVLGTTPATGP